MPVVSVKDVSKEYGKKKVLENVSFDIEEGEIFGLLGSNGAGKSTIMSIIFSLEDPTAGEVSFFSGQKFEKIKSRLAFVPQDEAFFKDFTVEKNMRFFGSIAGLRGKKLSARIDFLLNWLYLESFRKVDAGFLSGGYQKILNIALSLLHDPQLIFLDEPTVGLDPKMRQLFWEKILELKKNGKTLVITTHYMDEAQRLCDRVALLKKGKLLAVGMPEELIKQYGGIKVVVFRVKGGVAEKDVEIIRAMVNKTGVICKEDFLFIPFMEEKTIGRTTAVAEFLINNGYAVVSSTTKEPDLEDVFLNLIGEKIGD